MSAQLLIYEKVNPVTVQKHKDLYIKAGDDYSYAQHLNSIPLMAVEFASAAQEYAIVFAGTEKEVVPAIITGAAEKENLFYGKTDGWRAKYIPAFIRRYPFVFSSSNKGETLTLCIDEEFHGCNYEGRGERLFDATGERTQYLQSMLKFTEEYQAQHQRTQLFCKKLVDLKLLEPMQAQFTNAEGKRQTLSGFMAIKREKVKALDGDQLLNLLRTDELELIYLHLQSMRNFTNMLDKVTAKTSASSEDVTKEEDATRETEASSSGTNGAKPVAAKTSAASGKKKK